MKPVRILVDSLADVALPNAQMTNAREIIRRLDPQHFHVSVFCAGQPDPLVASRPNTRIIQLPAKTKTIRIVREFIFGQHEILFYVKAAPANRLYAELRHFWRDGRATIGTIESQCDLRNEPTIAADGIHLWERTVLRCDYLFSNSQAVRQSLHKEYGLPSEVVPTGVDTHFFVPATGRAPNSRLRVLFAGSLRPFKQPQLLLDAASRFPREDFVLAGDGLMAEELKARVAREKLSNVHLLGPLSAGELKYQYQQADIFLFPSQWEGSPKVILEAAACGLPVIARNNYRPETVLHGQTGYLVASDEELYARLEQLLREPALRRSLGGAAREHSQQFDWNGIAHQWEEIFLRLRPHQSQGVQL